MRVLGIGGLDHNGSVTYCRNGRIESFLEAERPTRQKNVGLVNEQILECTLDRLSAEGAHRIGIADRKFWGLRREWLEGALTNRFELSPDVWLHHDCHAASALVASPWDRALCVSIDGKGDEISAMAAVVSRTHGVEERLLTVSSAHSLGRLWWAVSEFCGFPGHHSAGKTMALAAYGRPFGLFEGVTTLEENGGFRFYDPDAHPDTFRQVPRIQDWITDRLHDMRRTPEGAHEDVAASLQSLNTQVVSHLVDGAIEQCGIGKVCLSGGVALNGVTNHSLVSRGVVDDLFVVPCCDDRGLSLGAAALSAIEAGVPIQSRSEEFSPFLGPPLYMDDVVGWTPTSMEVEDVARRLTDGAIVAWCHGGDESGPRALGHRSLLATPTRPDIRDRLNELKGRESFRPFGCAIALDDVSKWFDTQVSSPYMLRIVQATEAARRELPAALHVDETSRLQTVRPDGGSTFWPLLDALGELGHPRVVLNTSLNESGEPLSHTASDAADAARRLGADLLMLDGICYERSDSDD